VRVGETLSVTYRGRDVASIIPTAPPDVESIARAAVAAGITSWEGGKPRDGSRRITVRGEPISETISKDRC
jgi:antitoxin (DNA-binding transcriptional repressor) of toxin-antitoxin stability system